MHRENAPLTNVNPFDHGTTSIEYRELTHEESAVLRPVVEEHWGISDLSGVEQCMKGGGTGSTGYRLRTNDGHQFFLKKGRLIMATIQAMAAKTEEFLAQNGVPTVENIQTKHGQSVCETSGGIYCLQHYIAGEHFDGSRQELAQVAENTALLHTTLATMPIAAGKGVEIYNQVSIQHDLRQLQDLLVSPEQCNAPYEISAYIRLHLQEISEYVHEALTVNMQDIPLQPIHSDLHPHNILFGLETKKLRAILDFETLRIAPIAMDVGHTMHRFARTCGTETEKRADQGASIVERAGIFLERYQEISRLTANTLKGLHRGIQLNALRKIQKILIGGSKGVLDSTQRSNLNKQLIILREAPAFAFRH